MPTINQQGTHIAIVGTEQVVGSELTANKHYAADIDIHLLASGDTVEIRVKKRLLATGALVVKDFGSWTWPVTDQEIVYIPWETPGSKWSVTLKQTAGTAKNFDYIIWESP